MDNNIILYHHTFVADVWGHNQTQDAVANFFVQFPRYCAHKSSPKYTYLHSLSRIIIILVHNQIYIVCQSLRISGTRTSAITVLHREQTTQNKNNDERALLAIKQHATCVAVEENAPAQSAGCHIRNTNPNAAAVQNLARHCSNECRAGFSFKRWEMRTMMSAGFCGA